MTVEFSRILAEGVEVWNAWRDEHPHIQPDFNNIVFSPIQRQFNKSFHQILNLSHASFQNAGLQHASFLNTSLTNADFSNAELAHTRFNGADLSEANLSRLDLTGVDFSQAILDNTDLSGSDLSEVKNITQEQLSAALGDEETSLPSHMTIPEHWIEEITTSETISPALPLQKKKTILQRPLLLGGTLLAAASGLFILTDTIMQSFSSKNVPAALLSYQPVQVKQSDKKKSDTKSTAKDPGDKKKTVASKEPQAQPQPPEIISEETVSSGSTGSNGSHSTVYYYPSPYGSSRSSNTGNNTDNSDELNSESDTTLVLHSDIGEDLSGFLEAQQKAERRKKLQRALDNSVNSDGSGNSATSVNSQSAFQPGSHSLTNGNIPAATRATGNTITNNLPVAGKLLGR